jgi:ubiquinone biosynthesis protein UbiJ
MEESDVTDTDRIVLKGDTALCLYLLQLIQRLEVAICDSLVGERPEALAGLQLW